MNRLAILRLVVAAAGLSTRLTAQDTPTDLRIEADKTLLRSGIYLELEAAMPGFGALMKANGRPGGMVIVSGCEGEPARFKLNIPDGLSMAAGLTIITSTFPESYWTIQDSVVNLLPKQGVPAVMDVRIPEFEWDTAANEGAPIFRLFGSNGVKEHLAQLGIVPYSGLNSIVRMQKAPRIIDGKPEPRRGQKYKIENVSLMTALNTIVATYGDAFWVYEEQKCGGQKTYRISVR